VIRVKNLNKSFGGTPVIVDVSFEIRRGEKIFLSAPSGKGKTTLLRILCGLEKADSGSVEGLDPREISYCFQEPRLFPQLNVLENLICILPDPKAGEEFAMELLAGLGLEDAAQKYPHELSGGMKQRVALGRALMANRPVVLLDEPFAALDAERKESVRRLVAEHCREKTLLLVSHAPEDGAFLTERTIFL